MKKITKKLKGKKVLSLVLAAIMLATNFSVALPMLKLDASAANIEYDADGNIVIGGITQKRVVSDYATAYESYTNNFLNGAGKATEIVIPGLNAAYKDGSTNPVDYNDWVVQGLSYYPKNDWMMVTVYHNDGKLPSMIFALDAKSGKFVQAFAVKEYNANREIVDNMDHGGGLAFSEYNFYYSGDDSDLDDKDGDGDADQIAYAPLSYFDNPQNYDDDVFPDVIIQGAVDLPELNGAATAYVCYDDGILWAGNFYEDGIGGDDYAVAAMPANADTGTSLHNSMIYGYKLQGGDSETEWKYLTGAEGNTNDCAGNPSHCVAVSTDYEDIQYAIVDNGRIYLSCSWGTGVNDEWFANTVVQGIGNTPDYSSLIVGDIDLSQPGDTNITYTVNGGTVTKKAHELSGGNTTHFDMMPMSEGLCFVGDKLYISFEGASNKYLNEYSGGLKTGNCDYPVDVIWEIDPYTLMDENRTDSDVFSHYEKVTALEDINDEDEYIIVYESPEKNLVTQKNILYAFDAFGNFKEFKLSKSTDSKKLGYEGMIGYPISEYSIENDKLYFTNPERDGIANIRWHLTGVSDAANITSSNVKIQSELPYFMRNRNFYFENGLICMASDAALNSVDFSSITLEEAGDTGNFYLKNGESYLWCNDLSVSGYGLAVNEWYEKNDSVSLYDGIVERKGTFHTDALNKSGNNVIGKSIDTTAGDHIRQISIYKCVADTYSSTAKNRVYTDMSAELKADGTYTVTLDTYATSALQYKISEEEKPTDYIFVIDDSISMGNGDGTGMIAYDGDLSPYSVAGEEYVENWNAAGKYKVTHENGAVYGGPIYFKYNDEYINLRIETSAASNQKQYVWLFGTYRGQIWYWWPSTPGIQSEGATGSWQLTKPKESETMLVQGNDTRTRGNTPIYYGPHYRYTTNDYAPRLTTAKEAACNIIDQIKADGLDHRFAVTQYGEKTGFYTAGSSTITNTTDYSDVFWSKSQTDELKNTINSISVTIPTSNGTVTSNDGTDCANVFKHANGIINTESYKELYKRADKDGRNVAVIFISDGFAGSDSVTFTKGGWFSSDKTEYSQTGTLTDANNVIKQAKTLKEDGAFIYTILVGQTSSKDYKKDIYMQAISSQYPEATSVDTVGLGGECVENTVYFYNLSKAISSFFTDLSGFLFKNTKLNDDVSVEKLAGDTVIIEQLSEAFIIPKVGNEYAYDYDVKFYKGYYDCLGRFQFETKENTVDTPTVDPEVVTLDNDRPAIQIKGFNYSEQYIANGHAGNILRVTIHGLEANADAEVDITNTSINDITTTAIYQSLGKTEPLKYFPTEYFTIPEYTYVLDYGLDMLDTEVNGTLKSVSVDLRAQRDANGDIAYKTESENGLVKIADNNLDLLYHTTPTNMNDSGYVLIQRDNGKYDWFEIKIVPASNVYFEEDDMNVKKTDVNNNNKLGWTTAGTKIKDYRNLTEEGDVVGFENAYDVAYDSSKESTAYSNGTAKKVTVTQSNRNSKTQTFDFVGTGFDIVSRCGSDTGILLVNIKNSAGKSIAASLVDTYCEAGTFNQTPVFNWSIDKAKGETYGTYTVEVSALYLSNAGALNPKSINKSNLIDTGLKMNTSASFDEDVLQAMLDEAGVEDVSAKDVELVWFDDNSIFNGGTGVAPTKKGTRNTTTVTELVNYIDGFRVYNPLGTDPSVYTEKNVSYANVIDNLASLEDPEKPEDIKGIAFITGLGSDVTSLSYAQYQQSGPKGELYLDANTDEAISFKINRGANEKVMLGLRAVNGATTINVNGHDISINSATEMYYDISHCISGTTDVPITVKNVGSAILAVNHIKFSGGDASNGTVITPRSLARSADATETTTNKFLPLTQEDLVAIESVMSAEPIPTVVKNGVVIPLVEEEIPEDNTNTDNDNTNDGTDTEGSEDGGFGILSLIKMLIAFIEQILRNALGAGSIA